MDIRIKNLFTSGLFAVFTAGVFIPQQTQKIQTIFARKILTIQTSKSDPPRIAFNLVSHASIDSSNEWSEAEKKIAVGLVSGNFVYPGSLKNRVIQVPEMIVTRSESFTDQSQKDLKVAMQSYESRGAIQESIYSQLTAEQRVRLEEAQLRNRVLDSDWSVPSFEQEAKKIIYGSQSVVTENLRQQEAAVDVVPRAQPNRLSGIVELKGLPPPNGTEWQINIARYDDGVKVEDARFDQKNSRYSINVADLEGSIRAQLVDVKRNEVIGEGSIRLMDYAQNQQSKITVEKTHHYFASNFPSFYEVPGLQTGPMISRRQKPTNVHLASLNTSGKSDAEGAYKFDLIDKRSWMLVRAEREGFKEGMFLSSAGIDNSLPLMPAKMIEAMRSIVSEQRVKSDRPATGAIIWGQIIQGKKPLKGVRARIEGHEEYQPIYFNQLMIPDLQLEETSENGYFAFIDLDPGFFTVTANVGEINLSYVNVYSDADTVTTAVLENKIELNPMSVKTFDAFSGSPKAVNLEMQSLPQEIIVQGFSKIKTPRLNRLGLAQVLPEDQQFLPSLQLYNDLDESLHLPLIKSDWLQDIEGRRKINRDSQKGTIIGFIKDWQFKVFLGHEENFPKENIVFFDSKGDLVDQGVPGGGFIIFNVPRGTQSIVVTDESSEMIYNQVAPIDPSALVVLKY